MLKRLLYAAGMLAVASSAGAVNPPVGLNFSGYDGRSVNLSWNAVEGATGYQVSVWSLGPVVTEAQDVNLVISKDNPEIYTPAVDGHLDEAVLTFSISGTDGLSDDQTLPLIFRQADANHLSSSIFRGDIFIGQLKSYSTLSSNTIFGGYPIDELTECLYIAAGPSGEVPSAPGTMTITRVVNTYRPSVYVKKDESVATNSLSVDGLDPAANYYAVVKAVAAGEVSADSEVLLVDGVTPVIPTGATNVTSESYTANWEANAKAYAYEVTNYEIIKAPGAVVLSEDGSRCTEGTFDDPVEVDSFDAYTSVPDWAGASCLVAEGMFGVPDGSFRGGRPIGGYLISPTLDLSANGGKMTVSVELQATPGDVINVYAGDFSASKVHALTIPEDGSVSATFALEGGTAECDLHFDSTTLKKFFIRTLSVAQGEPVEVVLLEDSFDKSTEGTFDSPVERIDPDDYTSMPGWTVNSAIAAEGMFGTFDGMIYGGRNYGGGEMATPALGFSDGDVTVSLRLQSSMPGEDEILVYVGDYNPDAVTSIPVPADGIVDATVTLSGAFDGASVHVDSKMLKKFMLDNIKLTQMLQPGQKSLQKRESATVLDGTSHTFTGLNADSEYGYTVHAKHLDFFGYVYEGEESEMKEIGQLSGVENVAVDGGSASPVVSVVFTDMTGRRLLAPAPGTIVIRTEIRADGTHASTKLLVR